ncbi:9036_t:CDS:2 [Cetraspora pellucida]|uniref:9036_t:CDS:1 n=1 Tax=Cetraspora pellucida TaxID=1433469 RepID=A0A9N9ITX6_9GLOM|nr:9036_t:CDS:2 [Cetraspora pellucida]
MSQNENEFHASVSTNVINNPKVKAIPQLSYELANVAEKDQSSSDNNVIEISEANNFHKQHTMSKTRFILVVFGLSLAVFLSALDQTIVATAFPAIALEFKSLDEIVWVGTAYLVTETMLIISRAVSGLGLVMIIITEIVPISERGKYQGLIGACFIIASVMGPLLGGVFTDKITWRWAFFINIPLGIITFVFVVFLLHLPSPTGSFCSKLLRIDWWGSFTLFTATILLLLPLNWAGSKYEWSDPIIIILLCLGGIGYIIFILIEAKFASKPIAPPTTSGLELLPFLMSIAFTDIFTGQLVSRTVFFSYGTICIFGSILMAVGSVFISMFSENTSEGQIVGYSIITGIGIGSIMQTSILAGQGIVQYKDIATVTAMLSFFRDSLVFGTAILGTVFNNVFNSNLPPQFQGSLGSISSAAQGQIPEFLIHNLVLAFDAAFRIVIVFAGLTFISSLPLITVKPHRDDKKVKPSLEL